MNLLFDPIDEVHTLQMLAVEDIREAILDMKIARCCVGAEAVPTPWRLSLDVGYRDITSGAACAPGSP